MAQPGDRIGPLETQENKGQPDGYAPLDSQGKIPEDHVQGMEEHGNEWHEGDGFVKNLGNAPSIEAGDLINRPAAGENGRIYIAVDEQEIFRDNGSEWESIGGAVVWEEIEGKPNEFTPEEHGNEAHENEGFVENIGNTPSIGAGSSAARPSAGQEGRIYIDTDEQMIYRDTGTEWVLVGGSDTMEELEVTDALVLPVGTDKYATS